MGCFREQRSNQQGCRDLCTRLLLVLLCPQKASLSNKNVDSGMDAEYSGMDSGMDFEYMLAAGATKNCQKKTVVIQSAASAASVKGGCASSRLDHGLKFYVIRGGCASSRLIHRFSDCAEPEEEFKTSSSSSTI